MAYFEKARVGLSLVPHSFLGGWTVSWSNEFYATMALRLVNPGPPG